MQNYSQCMPFSLIRRCYFFFHLELCMYRLYGVPGFLSSRPDWFPPPPNPPKLQESVAPYLWVQWGRQNRLRDGELNSDDGTDTLVLYVKYNTSTV
jgi:hypothetical protein